MTDSFSDIEADEARREPSRPSAPRASQAQIEETDILVLRPYDGWTDSDGKTLVGLGPAAARAVAALRARTPAPPKARVLSEPPGPWGSDEEEPPRSVRRTKVGVWAIAATGGLILAGAAIVGVRTATRASKPVEAPTLAVTPPEPVTTVAAVTTSAPALQGDAGLDVPLSGVDVRVFLDGVDRGRPPVSLRGLAAGSHTLAISGSTAYAPYEQIVTLEAAHVALVEPVLALVWGTLRITPGEGAEGAAIEVLGDNERREIAALPARLETSPGDYRIIAKKKGFLPFENRVTLSTVTPEAEIVVDLERDLRGLGGVKVPLVTLAETTTTPSPSVATPPAAASTMGSLSITSSQPSSVVVDGRPLGKAPRVLELAAGAHTVVFVHPKLGRKSVSVNVLPGRQTSASVDF